MCRFSTRNYIILLGGESMTEFINLIVNNGLAVVVCGYFMYSNYKFNDKLVSTLTAIETRLEDIEKEKTKNGNE